MFFFNQDLVGCGAEVIKECSCGRRFTANDWLDLDVVGLMDAGDDYSMLDLRNCPCHSTLAVVIGLAVDPLVGLPDDIGTRPLIEMRKRLNLPVYVPLGGL